MKATIVTIGDEILIGQIIDTNSAWIAQQLNEIGINIHEIISVSDTQQGILDGLNRSVDTSDLVLLTGGLGPTKDDITKQAIAEFLQEELVFNEYNFELIKEMFNRRGREITPEHKDQCYLPASTTIIENKMGTAPGMLFTKDQVTIVSMPGVPYEMKYIMENGLLPKLRGHSEQKILHTTIRTAGKGESIISMEIDDIAQDLPAHIKLAFLPGISQVRLRLSATGTDQRSLEKDLEQFKSRIVDRLGDLVFGFDDDKLVKVIGDIATNKGILITTAESCTGGYIAHEITSVSGSSKYYVGGIVAYSNEIKQNLLGVQEQTIFEHGAVSEQTVLSMLEGVLTLNKADAGIAVSGIAGPTGGTADKPVGTIWVAYGSKSNRSAVKLQLNKDRVNNIRYTSAFALNLLRKFLMEL